MNWFKQSQIQFPLFGEKPSPKEKPSKKAPKVTIWGLSQSGTLTVIIDGKQYEYPGVTPHEEIQLNNWLKHKNYSNFFAAIRNLSERKMTEPFKRTL